MRLLQRQLVEQRGMTYLDLRPQFTNPDGSYTDSFTDATGTVVRLRGRDGISFFKAGNNRMGELVLAAIVAGDVRTTGRFSKASTMSLALSIALPSACDHTPFFRVASRL